MMQSVMAFLNSKPPSSLRNVAKKPTSTRCFRGYFRHSWSDHEEEQEGGREGGKEREGKGPLKAHETESTPNYSKPKPSNHHRRGNDRTRPKLKNRQRLCRETRKK